MSEIIVESRTMTVSVAGGYFLLASIVEDKTQFAEKRNEMQPG